MLTCDNPLIGAISLAVDSAAVYVACTRNLGGSNNGSLWRVPKDGSAPAAILQDANGGVAAVPGLGGLLSDGARVYFGGEVPGKSQGVYSVPVTGGAPTLLHGPLLPAPDAMIGVGDNLVFVGSTSCCSTNAIATMPKSGGAPAPVVTQGDGGAILNTITTLIADLGSLYWIAPDQSSNRALYRVSLTGGTPTPLASFGTHAGDELALVGGYFYFAIYDEVRSIAQIEALPVDGSGAPIPVAAVPLVGLLHPITSNSSNLFFMSTNSAADTGAIYRCP
jgi:hypothetical protein